METGIEFNDTHAQTPTYTQRHTTSSSPSLSPHGVYFHTLPPSLPHHTTTTNPLFLLSPSSPTRLISFTPQTRDSRPHTHGGKQTHPVNASTWAALPVTSHLSTTATTCPRRLRCGGKMLRGCKGIWVLWRVTTYELNKNMMFGGKRKDGSLRL